ncbi:hypothetical protein BDN72DRAFT_781616, partial [Pluteus cervinus]
MQLLTYVGPADKHTVYEGEAVGGILAAKLLQGQDIKDDEEVSIYVDNQSIITGAKKIHNRSGQYLLNTFHDELQKVPTIRHYTRKKKMAIRWISAHSGVEGNERVDELAKMAAKGGVSEIAQLPQCLEGKRLKNGELPHNIAAMKAEKKKFYQEMWKER